jgi:hypothetical protein
MCIPKFQSLLVIVSNNMARRLTLIKAGPSQFIPLGQAAQFSWQALRAVLSLTDRALVACSVRERAFTASERTI